MKYGFILPHWDVHTLALIMLIQWSSPCLNAVSWSRSCAMKSTTFGMTNDLILC
jgi:hypothetical protein